MHRFTAGWAGLPVKLYFSLQHHTVDKTVKAEVKAESTPLGGLLYIGRYCDIIIVRVRQVLAVVGKDAVLTDPCMS